MFCLEYFCFRKENDGFSSESVFKTAQFKIDYCHLWNRKYYKHPFLCCNFKIIVSSTC